MKSLQFAVNPDTFEVLERTPDKCWKESLASWIACRHARKSSYHCTVVPSPMPWGHIMFQVRKGNHYKPTESPPKPIWSDGIGCLYAGQRVGWEGMPNFRGGPPNWMYGIVMANADDGNILIRLDHGGTCTINPYNLA